MAAPHTTTRKSVLLGIVTLLIVLQKSTAVDITVTAPVGNITGSIQDVAVGPTTQQIAAYRGIPYAEPPVEQRRFAKPVPKANFESTFVAQNNGAACPQITAFAFQGEDCLYLNIFSPKLSNIGNTKYPVMIWVHGGSFLFGAGKDLTSDIMASFGKVVVVAINYRLGPFGFLTSGEEVSSGNYGLWDQHLAISWVQKNIESFGGDATKVTIFGESAGSASVVYQTIYPGNENLFQRAIAQSGSVNAQWTLKKNPGQTMKAYAAMFNCSRPTSGEIMSCLREVEDVSALIQKSFISFSRGGTDWTPTMDNDFITQERLDALNHPIGKTQLPHFRKLDLLMGTNGFEGEIFVQTSPQYQSVFANASATIADVKKASADLLQGGIVTMFGAELGPMVYPDIQFQYENFEDPLNRNMYMVKLDDTLTDSMFFVPTYTALENHVINNTESSTYQYEFNELSPLRPHTPWMTGALHADDVNYVSGAIYQESAKLSANVRNEQWEFSKKIMTYWTNFAKTGNPNSPMNVEVQWQKYDVERRDYIYLTSSTLETRNNLHRRRAEFWTSYLPSKIHTYQNPKVVVVPVCTSGATVVKYHTLVMLVTAMVVSFRASL